jgi:hypothetical protein
MLSLILFLFGLAPQQSGAAAPAPAQQNLRISGTVLDAVTGLPVEHALVAIGSNNPNLQRVTQGGSDGGFVFENVEPGKYVLSARHRGYLAQNYQQHESFTTAVVVGPGLDTENLRFLLPPAAEISGQVSDELTDPVRNAQVLLFQQSLLRGKRATRVRQRASTDDEGHFHFGHLPPGTYFVCVSARPWYAMNSVPRQMQLRNGEMTETSRPAEQPDPLLDVAYAITFFTNATDIAGAAPIVLQPGDKQIADISLQPIPALHILLKTPAPQEAQNSFVQVTQPLLANEQENVQAIVENLGPGVMEVNGLPPGRFNLRFVTSKANESTVRSQSVQLSGNTQVDVSEASSGPTVSGVVQMDDGAALAQPANVQLRNLNTGELIAARSEQDGQFAFKGEPVAAGNYELIVFEQAGTVVRNMTASGAKVTGHSLQISGAQDVRVNVVLTKGSGRITGFALKEGKPVGGAMVMLVPQDPENNLAVFRLDQSDTDGSFTLGAVPPGNFTVVAIENGWDLEWATPGVLQKYLAAGEKVHVSLNAKLEIKVSVQ